MWNKLNVQFSAQLSVIGHHSLLVNFVESGCVSNWELVKDVVNLSLLLDIMPTMTVVFDQFVRSLLW